MCGLAGYVGTGDLGALTAMCDALVHRGPDDFRTWEDADSRVALGFRRLTILDPVGGSQPMLDAAGRVAVVFNGEIYNHRELRAELAAMGCAFRTDHSDTEVLLHGYLRWGVEMLHRLNGMFAFALYDRQRHKVLLARDRFGKKPLYYAHHANGLVFASELGALRRHPSVRVAIDRSSLQSYFAFGYVPAPQTMLSGAAKLCAGDYVEFDIVTGTLRVSPYWRYRIRPQQPPAGDEAQWERELLALLRAAVGRRLEADVPLGFLLSGGLDSSTVVALARGLLPRERLQTFTIGFADPSYDESGAARATSAALGTDHVEHIVAQTPDDSMLRAALGVADEPVADGSILPTYLLSRLARTRVTVALSGDGGDELFAGYDPFAALGPARLYSALVPQPVHRLLRRSAEHLPRLDTNLSLDFKIRRTLRGLSYREPIRNAQWMAPASIDEIASIVQDEPRPPEDLYAGVAALWSQSASEDPGDRLLEYFAQFYLTGDVLTKVDRTSMHASLEVRCPFLDRDVVDFCLALPFATKRRGRTRKHILRRAVAAMVPPDVLSRPKKGFGIPVSSWLRSWTMPSLERAESLGLRSSVLEALWTAHRERRADNRGVLFAWLCLDRWAEANAF